MDVKGEPEEPQAQFKWAMRNPGLGSASPWGLSTLPGDYGFSSGSGGNRESESCHTFPGRIPSRGPRSLEKERDWSLESFPGLCSFLLSLGLDSLGLILRDTRVPASGGQGLT